jgi:hypothetical protein
MNEYLLIYQGGDQSWRERSAEEQKRVMDQWGAWFKELETSGHLRSGGAPLAPGGATLKVNGGKIKTDKALPEVKELIGGFSIIAADSLEQATELAKGTPFLKNNPSGTVVIRPIAQMM